MRTDKSHMKVHNRKEKAELLISLTTIKSDLFCFAFQTNFTVFGSFFWWLFFFSATIKQVASPAQASGVVQEMLIFLAKETRATTFWQLPRLPWLIESDSEHMHTHRHTPTHTVGGERQAHMHRDAGRRMDRELVRHRQMCCKCDSYLAVCY